MKNYPDVTALFERKKTTRRELAQLSFEEKIAIVRRLQKRRAAIKQSTHSATARKVNDPRTGKE